MDERTWSKARNLADAFSEAYDEDVAVVLGEALLETLAGLLVPENEKPSVEDVRLGSVADAKWQHPAYLPGHESCWLCMRPRHRGACWSVPTEIRGEG